MESQRQQKFARLLQRDLATIFQQDSKHWFDGAFITVTSVRVSPDLSVAKVYLSFLLTKDPQGLLERIEERNKQIRHQLAARIKNQVRIIPELRFYPDDTAEYASHIDSLLDKLDIPPEENDEDVNRTRTDRNE
ncbi:ribosome-binding factor A [Catalinimonas alkaloidigena]|uniref:Ribosome-binding factor A n=1 Tax=Catalinimonas alkaloidigena TaxID=1075417 RepID=A0A1G9ENZ4_9BACT|nr:30S ribosome-binding factor RbfA [Catalinimonas alkaloidigena]SDK77840.1 ribosome-binding factor A [Catalinimonas alkaloidigena]